MIFLKVNSYLHVQGSEFGGKFNKFGKKPFQKLNFAEFMEFIFSKSGPTPSSLNGISK